MKSPHGLLISCCFVTFVVPSSESGMKSALNADRIKGLGQEISLPHNLHQTNCSRATAAAKSRLSRAMCSTLISFGQAASHSY